MKEQILSAAANLFSEDEESFEMLHGGNFSSVYSFRRGGQELILRLTPPDTDIDRASMDSILHWMKYLADHKLKVPRPLRSNQGRLVEEVSAGTETWLVSAVEKAAGVLAERLPFEDWNGFLFEDLGSSIGKLHRLAQDYQPPAGVRPRPQWDQVSNNNNPVEELTQADPAILAIRAEVLEQIHKLPRNPKVYGLIHGDLQCANFFVDLRTDTVTIFDFDDCCCGWYLMDIALPLLDFLVVYPGVEREAFAWRFLSRFLRGYRKEHPLDAAWLNHLPLFITLLEIGLYLQVAPFAAECTPESWVGKFMVGRREGILGRQPFVALDLPGMQPDTD